MLSMRSNTALTDDRRVSVSAFYGDSRAEVWGEQGSRAEGTVARFEKASMGLPGTEIQAGVAL
jgi:hypothetical protein